MCKIHPKICKRFSSEKEYRFKADCEYSHERSNHDDDKKVLLEKVDIREKIVNEMTKRLETKNHDQMENIVHVLPRKVLSLENELKVIKNVTEIVED